MMEKFGLTVKKIRTDKGLLMKEVYGGVVGRTFAYKFEKGEVNLALENFLEVMDNLQMESPDEFFFLHFGEPYRNKKPFLSELDAIPNSEELEFYEKYKDSKNPEERFYAYLLHLHVLLERRISEDSQVNEEELDYMKDYLLKMDSWTLTEMDNASIILPILPDSIREMFLERFRMNYKKYRNYKRDWARSYANHLLNYALIQVMYNRVEEALELLPELKNLMKTNSSLQSYLYINLRVGILVIVDAILRKDEPLANQKQDRLNALIDLAFEDEEVRETYPQVIQNCVDRARDYVGKMEK
jgi:hypothetical protein